MRDRPNESLGSELPRCAADFIGQVTKTMRYRRKVRQDVQAELTAHFEDELRDCADAQEREQRAKKLIEEFGDAKLLAVLCRRAKKRWRPLWAKVAIRALQAVGILVLYSMLCPLRLFIGSPSLKVDYLAWFSAHTRGDRVESLNAKPYFDKAAELVRDKELIQKALGIAAMRPGDMNEPQRKILADVVEHNAEAFETLRQGVTKPYYWVQYETAVNELPADVPLESVTGFRSFLQTFPDIAWAFNRAMMAHGPGYKRLAQALRASISWRACHGDVSGALDDCLVLMDFGMHLQGRGTQAEQLLGMAIEGLGNYAAFRLLNCYDVAGSDLTRIQGRLADLHARHGSMIDVTGDRTAWLAFVQRTFTDDGRGNGRVLREGLPSVASDWKDGIASLLLFGYPDRREMTTLIETLCSEWQLALDTPPSDPQHEARQERWKTLANESSLLSESAPAMERIGVVVWRTTTSRRALLTTLAVMRYAKDKGAYPPSLDKLATESYLSELPLDPYSGKPFGYRPAAEGFLLYSWGENLVDNDGRHGTGQNGVPRLYAENGGWVFWPVGP